MHAAVDAGVKQRRVGVDWLRGLPEVVNRVAERRASLRGRPATWPLDLRHTAADSLGPCLTCQGLWHPV